MHCYQLVYILIKINDRPTQHVTLFVCAGCPVDRLRKLKSGLFAAIQNVLGSISEYFQLSSEFTFTLFVISL